jgi:hypothetical protein
MADRPEDCRRCRRGPLVPEKTDPADIVHKGRGLCECCYAWCDRNNTLHQYPTTRGENVDRRATVEAYLELADSGLTKTEIADRIGVGRGSMYDALSRDPRTRNHARRLDPAEAARLRRSVGARC